MTTGSWDAIDSRRLDRLRKDRVSKPLMKSEMELANPMHTARIHVSGLVSP